MTDGDFDMEICKNELFTKEMDRLNMGVSYAAEAVLDADWSFAGENPTFTRMYYVLSGEGTIFCHGRGIPMRAGNVYILPAGMNFSYTIRETMEKVYFHVNLLRYDRYDLMRSVDDCIVLTRHEQEIQMAASLLRKSADVLSALQLKQLLYKTLIDGINLSGGSLGCIEQYSSLVKKTIKYVEENMRSGMTSAEIAAELFVSDSRLRKAFREEVGVPIGKYIADRLLFKAEQQLRLTDRPIKEIAAVLGYCDPFYFSRVFSARYGTSPTAYRRTRGG